MPVELNEQTGTISVPIPAASGDRMRAALAAIKESAAAAVQKADGAPRLRTLDRRAAAAKVAVESARRRVAERQARREAAKQDPGDDLLEKLIRLDAEIADAERAKARAEEALAVHVGERDAAHKALFGQVRRAAVETQRAEFRAGSDAVGPALRAAQELAAPALSRLADALDVRRYLNDGDAEVAAQTAVDDYLSAPDDEAAVPPGGHVSLGLVG